MKHKCNNKKNNNKGFSLIELLVAVTILGIVVGPILSSFVSSAKFNAQAKVKQTATGAAESLMEGLKGYSVDSITAQFTKTTPGGVKTTPFKVYSTTAFEDYDYSHIKEPNSSTTTDKNPYYFYLYGMEYQDKKYDAKVVLEPYSAASYSGVQNLDSIQNMNGYKDAVYTDYIFTNKDGFYGIIDTFVAKMNTLSGSYTVNPSGIISWEGDFTRDKVLNDLTNRNRISIEKVTTVNATSSSVKVSVVFYATVDEYPYTDAAGNLQKLDCKGPNRLKYEYIVDKDIYNNDDTGATLENVFMFVYPAYSSTSYNYPMSDSYVMSSTDRLNFFFVKQKNSSYTNAQISVFEATYVPNIDATNSDISLYHNICTDLVTNKRDDTKTYNRSNVKNEDSLTLYDGLTSKKDTVLLYKVKVYIYDYEGTSNTFPDDGEIYLLEGTVNG